MNDLTHSTVCRRCQHALPEGGECCPYCLELDLTDASQWDELLDKKTTDSSWDGLIVGEVIGHGGMGTVFRARQLKPVRDVALKMLRFGSLDHEVARQRLVAEAAALAELDHPAILPIYASGETDGCPWLAMKLAENGSLADQMTLWKGMWANSAGLIAVLAEALHHAHERGVIHRDLKPANILFDSHDRPFIADFGLAKWLDGSSQMTMSQAVLGTPAYMSPEVAQKGASVATTASDIYGLGAVFYELLTQCQPFAGPTPIETARRVVAEDLTPPRAIDQTIPRDLEAIILKAMASDPSKRYASAAEFAQDLRSWIAGDSITARSASLTEKTWRWSRRHPLSSGLIVALCAVLFGGGVILWRAYQAEQRARQGAEERIDFMTRSLPAQLEPLGRLSVLDGTFADIARYYESQSDDDSAPTQVRKAAFQLQWAKILKNQGRIKEALDCCQQAALIADRGIADEPANSGFAAILARSQRQLAEIAILEGKFDEALSLLTAAKENLSFRLKSERSTPSLLLEKVEILNEEAFAYVRKRLPPKALERYDESDIILAQAIELKERADPVTARRLAELDLIRFSYRGETLIEAKLFNQACLLYEDYVKKLDQALLASPGDASVKFSLSVALNRWADSLSRLKPQQLDKMASLWQRQETLLADLVLGDPTNLKWRAEWGLSALAMAQAAHLSQDKSGSRQWLRTTLKRIEGIPPQVHNGLVEARTNALVHLTENLHEAGLWEEGHSRCQEGLEAAWKLLLVAPQERKNHSRFETQFKSLVKCWYSHEPGLVANYIAKRIQEAKQLQESGDAARWWKLTQAAMHRRQADCSTELAVKIAEGMAALTLRSDVCQNVPAEVVNEILPSVWTAVDSIMALPLTDTQRREAFGYLIELLPTISSINSNSISPMTKRLLALASPLPSEVGQPLIQGAITKHFQSETHLTPELEKLRQDLLSIFP